MADIKKLIKEVPSTVGTYISSLPRVIKGRNKTSKNSELDEVFKVALTADLHTDGDGYRDRTDVLRKCFAGISANYAPHAIVMAGDITNAGHVLEYGHLKRLLNFYAKGIKVVPQMGNHDGRGTSIYPFYEEGLELFLDFCDFCGIKTKKPYFTTDIHGYTFIVLGPEKTVHNESYITEEQISWLDEQLEKASKIGKPVFIVNHQPPNNRNGVNVHSVGAGGIGENSDIVDNTLLKHAEKGLKMLYVSGHMHRQDEYSFEKAHDNLYYLNLDTLEYKKGLGYKMEVKGNDIHLEGFDFVKNTSVEGRVYDI